MSGGQSYIVRLVRRVESWLSENDHAFEASRVGRIVQKLAQADDIHEELNVLHRVEDFDQFSLRLMWLLDVAERGHVGLENGVIDYQASSLGRLLIRGPDTKVITVLPPSNRIDELYFAIHRFGRAIEELKNHSIASGAFKEIDEVQVYHLLNEIASLEEHAVAAGKTDLSQFTAACAGFLQYVLDNSLLQDVRVVNVLDNVNFTLQTVYETAGVEDNDSLQSTIQLLKQPKDLLD